MAKNGVPKEFTISSGQVPRKGSPADYGIKIPGDVMIEGNRPEYEYPPKDSHPCKSSMEEE